MEKKISKTNLWARPAVTAAVIVALALGGISACKSQPKNNSTLAALNNVPVYQAVAYNTIAINTPEKGDTLASRTAPTIAPIKSRKIHSQYAKNITHPDSSANTLSSALKKNGVDNNEQKTDDAFGEMVVTTYNARQKADKIKADNITHTSVTVTTENTVKPVAAAPAKQEAHPQTGFSNFEKYLKDEAISPDNMTGTVSLSFTVNADGVLSNFKVLKSVSGDADQKAIALVKNGPGWLGNPNGSNKDITIKVKFHKAG